jgi:hypothetical protein
MAEKKLDKEKEKKKRIDKATEHLQLAFVELGDDYTATVEKGEYSFTLKPPLIEDDYKILNKFYTLKKELGVSDVQLSAMDELPIRILATLEHVISKISKKKTRKDNTIEWETIEQTFWEHFKAKMGGESFYSEIVFPLYEDYLNFKELIDLSVDELKKN